MSKAFKASRLPKQPGPAGWNMILSERGAPQILDEDIVADVAIIGAGFAGLSAARRLLQIDATQKITIIDAIRVGEGPAGRNSGFMIDLPHDLNSDSYAAVGADGDKLNTKLNRHAINFAKEFADEYQLPDGTFNPCGKINAAATEKGHQHNLEYGKHLTNLDEPYSLLSKQELSEITGTSYYFSGLYTPGTVMIQPAAYIRGLADWMRDKLSLFENSPVIEIKRQGESWTVRTAKASISAKNVILANNGHAESFGFFARRLIHTFTYASMTQEIPNDLIDGDLNWGVTPSDPMGTTVRRISNNTHCRIVTRTRFTYNPSMEVSTSDVVNAGSLHDRKFTQRFPKLTDVKMQYRWAGHLCLSWNGVPAHGEIEDGLFAAICQNGLGTTKGTLAGISAAELACGLETEVTKYMLALPEPKKIPPEPITWIGANATMRWREWRARKE